jgi:hypothetical protein
VCVMGGRVRQGITDYSRLASNSQSSCLSLLGAGVIGKCYHSGWKLFFYLFI